MLLRKWFYLCNAIYNRIESVCIGANSKIIRIYINANERVDETTPKTKSNENGFCYAKQNEKKMKWKIIRSNDGSYLSINWFLFAHRTIKRCKSILFLKALWRKVTCRDGQTQAHGKRNIRWLSDLLAFDCEPRNRTTALNSFWWFMKVIINRKFAHTRKSERFYRVMALNWRIFNE